MLVYMPKVAPDSIAFHPGYAAGGGSDAGAARLDPVEALRAE
jgi:hypothetical protein